jgi:hypothetical protein
MHVSKESLLSRVRWIVVFALVLLVSTAVPVFAESPPENPQVTLPPTPEDFDPSQLPDALDISSAIDQNLNSDPARFLREVQLMQVAAGYCGQPVLRAYERELQGLPKIASLGRSGAVPFGPPSLRVGKVAFPSNRGRILTGGSSFGFSLRSSGNEVPLGWNVISELSELNTDGTTKRVVSAMQKYVKGISIHNMLDFVLKVPTEPGPYRYDMSFIDGNGGSLGRYSEYLESVRPTFAVKLDVRRPVYRPGETLNGRVENVGTEAIEPRGRPWIQRHTGTRWQYVTGAPSGPGFPSTPFVGAGAAGPCLRVSLPSDLTPGRYRLVQGVRRAQPGINRHSKSIIRVARFSLVKP